MFRAFLLSFFYATAAVASPLARRSLERSIAVSNSTNPNNSSSSSLLDDCPGYAASNIATTDSSLTADLTLAGDACNVYGTDLKDLKLLVEYQTDKRLHVKIYDAGLQVYQVQDSVLPRPQSNNTGYGTPALEFSIVENPFSFSVKRRGSNETLFDSSAASLVFESQYVRLRTKLPDNPNLYGLGEHSDSFRLQTTNYRRTFWNSESPYIPRQSNLYGSHPVYFDHRGATGTHGVFLLNSDGMDININNTGPGTQYLEYNTIGGVLDFYFMAGPSPSDVSSQYAEIVGLPAMMPYWTFGFNQCKYGMWDVNYVAEVVGNYSTAGIPLETMWTDIDYMDLRQDFTTDPDRFPLHKMRELVDTLHSRDQHYVLILDPGIHQVDNYSTYVNGHEKDVFLKTTGGDEFVGVQWAGAVVWPDWLAPNTQEWWSDEVAKFFDPDTGINVDGLWVDMDEPSNFCPNITCGNQSPEDYAASHNDPPIPTTIPRPNTGRPIPGFPADFQPGGSNSSTKRTTALTTRQSSTGDMKGYPDRDLLYPDYRIHNHVSDGNISSQTVYTNISNYDGTYQYDTHNFYGLMMAFTTQQALLARQPTKRPFVLTRSTFAGAGKKVAHWFGDNASTWDDYRITIAQMLAFAAMHQMPMVGSDVCGFNGVADQYMCARWALLGAFQPFYRNHADISAPPQEFYQWPLVTDAAKKAIDARYRLLDYIYTALYRQTTTGVPLVNPLFFLYPSDANTFGIQYQWFYGSQLLISPVTDDYSSDVTFYLPDDLFYDFWTLEPIRGTGAPITRTGVNYTDIPVHIRGGSVLPMRSHSANTTALVRQQNFTIIIAPGTDGKASGDLYIDDGESITQNGVTDCTFAWDGSTLTATGTFDYKGADAGLVVESVVLLGQTQAAGAGGNGSTVTVEGAWRLDGPFTVKIG